MNICKRSIVLYGTLDSSKNSINAAIQKFAAGFKNDVRMLDWDVTAPSLVVRGNKTIAAVTVTWTMPE